MGFNAMYMHKCIYLSHHVHHTDTAETVVFTKNKDFSRQQINETTLSLCVWLHYYYFNIIATVV
jgi:hypothetical protein